MGRQLLPFFALTFQTVAAFVEFGTKHRPLFSDRRGESTRTPEARNPTLKYLEKPILLNQPLFDWRSLALISGSTPCGDKKNVCDLDPSDSSLISAGPSTGLTLVATWQIEYDLPRLSSLR